MPDLVGAVRVSLTTVDARYRGWYLDKTSYQNFLREISQKDEHLNNASYFQPA